MKLKTIFLTFLTVLITFTILSCQNPQAPETPKNQDKTILDATVEKLSIDSEVSETATTIELPLELDTVKISWSSNKTDIISNEGKVKHAEKAESNTVELTPLLL